MPKGEGKLKRIVVSGIVLTLLLIGMLTLAFNIQRVKASGTIYIKADGSIEGTTHISTADNITYTFTGNIYDEIVVQRSSIVVDGAGYTLQGPGSGIGMAGYVSNVTIKNMEIKAFDPCIALEGSNNSISGNNLTNSVEGIVLQFSSHIRISGNIIVCERGIFIWECSNISIFRNNITVSPGFGIRSVGSSNFTISGNTISSPVYGIDLWSTLDCFIYHNNFVNNTKNWAYSPQRWDDGYPSGGNYWSDYNGTDFYSGPYQNESGSDGIGDTAYVINAYNRDRYPLMYPWGSPPPPTCTLTICSQPIGVTFTVDGVPHTTPWSENYSEGASVGLVMPETHSGYMWYYWLEDIDTNRIKTVTVDTNITLTGVFRPPVGGIYIPVNKLELLAPYIGLTILLAVAVITVGYVKKRKRHTEINS